LSDTRFEYEEAPPEPLCFVLGRDHGGHWIVQEAHGLCGGLFRQQRRRHQLAKFESADREKNHPPRPRSRRIEVFVLTADTAALTRDLRRLHA